MVTLVKNGFSGVEVECRRGAKSELKWLAKIAGHETMLLSGVHFFTESPFYGYLHKDTPTADYSDVLVVTVPEKR